MPQQHQTSYHAPTSIELLKNGFGPVNLIQPLPDQVSVEVLDSNRASTLSNKRLRTVSENDHLEASEIYRTSRRTQTPSISEYSQRRAAASTPIPSLNPLLSLSHPRYGLPESLVKNFATMGINSIYPWQSSCLLGRGLLNGQQNLVYSAPTGGGKS